MADRSATRRRLLAATGVVVALGVAWWQRSSAIDAVRALGAVSPVEIALLVGCWALWSLARTVLHRLSLRRATWAQSFVLAEVGEAAHSMPAGAASGVGARIAIGRSFGQDAATMSVSYVVVAEALSTGLWLLVLGTSVRRVLAGDAGSLERGAIVLALLGLSGTALIAWVVVRPSRLTAALLRGAQWAQARVARRWAMAGTVDLARFVDDARREAGRLVRRRWHAIIAAGTAAVVSSGLLLVAAVRALSIDTDLWSVWGGFALVTAAIGFAPTPGGVGIAETAMASMLVAAGATTPEAIAVVVIHRGFTFVLPLATGAVAFAAWTQWSARTRNWSGPDDRLGRSGLTSSAVREDQ